MRNEKHTRTGLIVGSNKSSTIKDRPVGVLRILWTDAKKKNLKNLPAASVAKILQQKIFFFFLCRTVARLLPGPFSVFAQTHLFMYRCASSSTTTEPTEMLRKRSRWFERRRDKTWFGDRTKNEITHGGRLDEKLPLFSTSLHCLCARDQLISEQSQNTREGGCFFLFCFLL